MKFHYSEDELLPASAYFAPPSIGNASTTTGRPAPFVSASSGRDRTGVMDRLARLMSAGRRHSSTEEACRNLSGHGGSGVWLLGHGSPGSFETGDGDSAYTESRHVDTYTVEIWRPHFKNIWAPVVVSHDRRGVPHTSHSQLIIIGCSVGQGPGGEFLVQTIANVTNRLVSAYTGLVYVGSGIYYEKGFNWIKREPKADALPEPPFKLNSLLVGHAEAAIASAVQEAALLDEIAGVTVKRMTGGTETEGSFQGDIARNIVSALIARPPFRKNGGAIGAVTARCTIHFEDDPPLSFVVFADGLAEEDGGIRSYVVARNFGPLVDSLFPK